MPAIGRVDSLWRYPVKSMRGERITEAFAGFAGIYGDRIYAIRSTGAPAGFPYLTSREQERMLRFQPAFREAHHMRFPPNAAEAEALAPGVTPVYPAAAETAVDVTSPEGETHSIQDPLLLNRISDGVNDRHTLSLVCSDRSMADCRPVSIFGVWTARQLSDEIGTNIDPRRFRANIYVDMDSQRGFAEDELVGKTLRIGSKATMIILERDPRCKMITLDPDTSEQNADVMRCVANRHDGKAGVYAAVLIEGQIHSGDPVTLME